MGSKEIRNLQYRQAFAFIGVNGRQESHEKRGKDEEETVSVTQIFIVNRGKEEKNGEKIEEKGDFGRL